MSKIDKPCPRCEALTDYYEDRAIKQNKKLVDDIKAKDERILKLGVALNKSKDTLENVVHFMEEEYKT